MKRTFLLTLFTASCIAGVGMALAQDAANKWPAQPASSPKVVLPAGITEEMLAPPPVPRFMLEPPGKPLTMDEMMQQAREAERKAGVKQNPAPSKK